MGLRVGAAEQLPGVAAAQCALHRCSSCRSRRLPAWRLVARLHTRRLCGLCCLWHPSCIHLASPPQAAAVTGRPSHARPRLARPAYTHVLLFGLARVRPRRVLADDRLAVSVGGHDRGIYQWRTCGVASGLPPIPVILKQLKEVNEKVRGICRYDS